MNFLKKLFSSLKQGHQNGLVVFATCCVIVLLLGVNGFVLKEGDRNTAERRQLTADEDEQEAESVLVPDEEEVRSHYYTAKIEEYVSQIKPEEHVLQLAEDTENRQFVTSGKLISRQVRDVSTEEYEILSRIVEAESGAEPYTTRLLIANIILNRVESERFPNNITDVVFQNNGKTYQFSPISNGSYYSVTVQDSTRKAVEEALSGRDNSGGALYFMVRSISSPKSVEWFDTALTKMGQIGEIEYFK